MKKEIHPDYKAAHVTCGCGNTFETRSTKEKIAVEVCSNCHPFYTGKQKFVDTAGMVERFTKKWQGEAAQKAHAIANPPPKKSKLAQMARTQQTLAATFGAPKQAAPAPAPAAPAAPAKAPEAKPAAPAPAPASTAAPAPAKKA
jgi:large subunit ribosomal protein L31